ncbi:MAG: hypothetical protein ABF991_00065 [Liquorilactobacillus hordei]|uniref:hypothetical protein n=1 Tax=Liquorilactobacillus hordei TaxID=468911 RepID=UPI0039EC819A
MIDCKKEIDNGQELANKLMDLGYEPKYLEGSLQDNFFFEDMQKIRFTNGIKPRKYVMILENHLNTWSSNHILFLTDSEETYTKLFEEYHCLR